MKQKPTGTKDSSALEVFERQLGEFVLDFLSPTLNPDTDPDEPEDIEAQVQDWVRFAKNSKVISGTDVIPFNPYPYQVELCRAFLSHKGIALGKIRQAGITETFGNIFAWKASKNPAYTAVVFSQGGEATAKIAERVKRMVSSNPFCEYDKANTKEVSIVGGGTILFRTCNPGASRGLSSVHDILFDEWAFVPTRGLDKTLWSDITPAQEMVGDKARIAVVSTPPERPDTQYMEILKSNNGSNDYLKIARDMREGVIDPVQWWTDDNGWCKFFIHWKAHPIFAARENHLEQVRESKKLDNVKLQREYNLDFEIKDATTMVDLADFHRYEWPDALPENPWLILQSWDTAQSEKPGSSKWAGATYFLYGKKIMIVDAHMSQMTFVKGKRRVEQMARDWKPHLILIENKSSGADVIDGLREDTDNFPFPILPITPPRGDGVGDDPKIRRFSREVHQIHAGKMYLPQYAPWLTSVEDSLKNFPDKEYRDFVDQLSQALHYIRTEAQEGSEIMSGLDESLATVEDYYNDYG